MNNLYPTQEVGSVDAMTASLGQFQQSPAYTQLYVKTGLGTVKDLPRPDRQLIYDQAKRFRKALV